MQPIQVGAAHDTCRLLQTSWPNVRNADVESLSTSHRLREPASPVRLRPWRTSRTWPRAFRVNPALDGTPRIATCDNKIETATCLDPICMSRVDMA